MVKRIICVFLLVSMCMGMTGCQMQEMSNDKVRDIDYTVVPEAELPETLRNAIEEKKKEPFRLSYSDNEELYLVVGYGEQMSGGYSIVVDSLYQTDNTIVFGTTLNGPEDDADVKEAPTYPFLVVKMEFLDCEIIYE
ncbi:MAG: protease complex subunit PrcB family protein [Lachnospiraceae bacterium]|nr:protease complex subunit PrcB family protein [Lachnospiraceae bacterium]